MNEGMPEIDRVASVPECDIRVHVPLLTNNLVQFVPARNAAPLSSNLRASLAPDAESRRVKMSLRLTPRQRFRTTGGKRSYRHAHGRGTRERRPTAIPLRALDRPESKKRAARRRLWSGQQGGVKQSGQEPLASRRLDRPHS